MLHAGGRCWIVLRCSGLVRNETNEMKRLPLRSVPSRELTALAVQEGQSCRIEVWSTAEFASRLAGHLSGAAAVAAAADGATATVALEFPPESTMPVFISCLLHISIDIGFLCNRGTFSFMTGGQC